MEVNPKQFLQGLLLCCGVVSVLKLNGAYATLIIHRENPVESGTFWSLLNVLTVSPP
jgi:hypothetical protein